METSDNVSLLLKSDRADMKWPRLKLSSCAYDAWRFIDVRSDSIGIALLNIPELMLPAKANFGTIVKTEHLKCSVQIIVEIRVLQFV